MAVMGIFLAGVYAVACGGEKQAEKLRDLEFAVIGPDETPQELAHHAKAYGDWLASPLPPGGR